MGENNKCDIWGLSLSLRPPITSVDYEKVTFKREPHISTDEESQKMQKPNKTLMRMARMMEVDIKPQMVIDLEEMEITKGDVPAKSCGGFRDGSDEDEGGSGGDGGGGERKKLRLSKEQIIVLEHAFEEHTTLNTRQKVTLARQVNLKPRQVEVWFQNRRARTKLKQTEVDCEYLRKFCETLTEQNRKLQKEVQELRTLKAVSTDRSVVHGKNSHKTGTTLNMCPSCKTVSVLSFATTSKTPTNEAGCHPSGVLHRPVPLNLKKLSSTVNNNRMFESHLPSA